MRFAWPAMQSLNVALVALVLTGAMRPVHAEQNARRDDGPLITGELLGESAGELRFLVKGQLQSLKGIQRIDCPRSSPVMQNERPARMFHLSGGGTLTGELIRYTPEQITLTFRGKELTLSGRAVLAIEQLQGEQQVFHDDFSLPQISPAWKATGKVELSTHQDHSALKLLPKASVARALETPLSAGRVSMAFFDPPPSEKDFTSGFELLFGDEQSAESATIRLASSETFYTLAHSRNIRLTTQPLRRASGWRRLTILFDENRFQILIDSHLLAFGRPPQSPLNIVRLLSDGSDDSVPKDVWFDDFQLAEIIPRQVEPRPFSFEDQSQVLLAHGDGIYGEVREINSQRVLLTGAFGETRLPWNQLRRVIFAVHDRDVPSAVANPSSTVGWAADVTFARWVDHPYQPGDRLSVTLLTADADSLMFSHPLLGKMTVPWEQVDFIEPRFYGRTLILTSDVRHLGNQVQQQFHNSKPQGTAWSGEFVLENADSGSAILRVPLAELEPSGSQTPPGSRFLSELRNGSLGTEVFLNGKSLGRLNDHITRRSPVESPETVRLRVPPNVLRSGKNTWRIEQTPLRKNSREYDDCELGPIVLDIAMPEPD